MVMKSKDYESFRDAWNEIKNKYRLVAELYNLAKGEDAGYSKNLDPCSYEYEHDRGYVRFHLYMKLDKVMEAEYYKDSYELWENEQYYVVIVQVLWIESVMHAIYIYQKH